MKIFLPHAGMRFAHLVVLCLATGILGACASSLPVPGGDDKQNVGMFKSEDDLKIRVAQLTPGMQKDLVFALLGRDEHDFTRLDRPAISESLYGGGAAGFNGNLEEQERARQFLQTLEGYRLVYRYIDRDLGFSSPVRVQRIESGFNYTLTLIFHEGRLIDKPMLSGGVVSGSSSKTIFDYFSPAMLFNY
jgi:hypothetical protein